MLTKPGYCLLPLVLLRLLSNISLLSFRQMMLLLPSWLWWRQISQTVLPTSLKWSLFIGMYRSYLVIVSFIFFSIIISPSGLGCARFKTFFFFNMRPIKFKFISHFLSSSSNWGMVHNTMGARLLFPCLIAHVRYIKILTWLRGFTDKITIFSRLHCLQERIKLYDLLLSRNSQKSFEHKENQTK